MKRTVGKARTAARRAPGMAGGGDLLTARKLAASWGVTPGDVKKAIAATGAQPDATHCGYAYYGPATAARIRKHLSRG